MLPIPPFDKTLDKCPLSLNRSRIPHTLYLLFSCFKVNMEVRKLDMGLWSYLVEVHAGLVRDFVF